MSQSIVMEDVRGRFIAEMCSDYSVGYVFFVEEGR